MTADELTEGCWRARLAFNTPRSLVHRLLDPRTALRSPRRALQYALSNLITRREIHTKQGRPLGGPGSLDLPPLSESLVAPAAAALPEATGVPA
jgi:hypothetical protein